MKEKISQLADLIKLMRCDGNPDSEEYRFLLEIARQLGIGKTHLDALFGQEIEFNPPKDEVARIIQFHRLVLLMNFDKKTDPREINLIKDLSIKMGLNPNATNKVLDIMDKYPNKVVPPDVMISIFKEGYN
jgi:AraC-like DNA-binding protein